MKTSCKRGKTNLWNVSVFLEHLLLIKTSDCSFVLIVEIGLCMKLKINTIDPGFDSCNISDSKNQNYDWGLFTLQYLYLPYPWLAFGISFLRILVETAKTCTCTHCCMLVNLLLIISFRSTLRCILLVFCCRHGQLIEVHVWNSKHLHFGYTVSVRIHSEFHFCLTSGEIRQYSRV